MNTRKIKSLLTSAFIGFLVIPPAASAAQPEKPTFDGPIIERLPGYFSYEITLTNAADELIKARLQKNPRERAPVDYSQARIVQWKITRTDDITYVEMTDRKGKTGEMWVKIGNEVVRPPGKPNFFVNPPNIPGDIYHLDFGRYGYPFTGWISKACFDKTVTWNSLPALHFSLVKAEKVETGTSADGQPAEFLAAQEAWIDAEKRIPLAVRILDDTYTFKQLPAPEKKLVCPFDVANIFGQEIRRVIRLTSVPPSP